MSPLTPDPEPTMTTPPASSCRSGARILAVSWLTAVLLALPLSAQDTPPPPNPEKKPEAQPAEPVTAKTNPADGVVTLSPFTVTTDKDQGYYAENTLAGSRLNTNLADIAASITVVTKQKMRDTGSTDINDVFRYEANTEGSRSYTPSITDRGTAKDALSGYSFGNTGAATNNAQSNRIRGLGTPDSAINYYPAANRIPFDSYNTSTVEISRGPNSILFGLGSPAGIVNQSTVQADLQHNTATVEVRGDDRGSYRAALGFNQKLIDNKLAFGMDFLYDNEQLVRKPSHDLTRRQYATITYKPFKKTVILGWAENYTEDANRPNFITPRDWVTPWLQAGRPGYDPISRTITKQDTGTVTGPYTLSNLSPGYVPGQYTSDSALTAPFLANGTTPNPFFVPGIQFSDVTRPIMRIDNGHLADWFQRQPVQVVPFFSTPAQNALPTAATMNSNPSYYWPIFERKWTTSNAFPINPIYSSYQNPGVTNKAIYDWTKYNINQTNTSKMRAGNYNLELEHEITPDLFFSAGWFRQDIDAVDNNTLNQLTGATLTIDTNLKLPNGQANPYYGLPFVSDSAPDTFNLPETDDNYRAMLAYNLDFSKIGTGNKDWLGHHRLLAMWSKQYTKSEIIRRRLVYTGGDADATLRYLPNNTAPQGWNYTGITIPRYYYLASPGDPQAKVTHSSGNWNNTGSTTPFTSNVSVFNWSTGQFQNDSLTESTIFHPNGSFRTQRQVDSWNFAIVSSVWADRIVATLGWRRDDYKARATSTGQLTDAAGNVTAPSLTNAQLYMANGLADEYTIMNRWNHWDELSGDTKTIGFAVRPFKSWKGIEGPADNGDNWSDFARNFTLYYNQSTNFNPPATFQTDYFLKPLAKPTGKGKDYGFGFSAFHNKLVMRLTWFSASNTNERTSAAGTLMTRLAYGDTTLMVPWATAVVRLRNGANVSNPNWNTDAVNPLTAAMTQQVWDMVKLPVNYYNGLNIGATQDSSAKGAELQLTYNPSRNWTMQLTGGKQETTYTKVAPQFDEWQAVRMPVWLAATAPEIADFVDGGGTSYSLKNFWNGYGYAAAAKITNTDGTTSSKNYYDVNVTSQIALAKALEGVAAPDQRRYNFAYVTNYNFN